MAYISFLNKIIAHSPLAKKKLFKISKINKNQFQMPITYGSIKNLNSVDQLIYLRDHFSAETKDQIYVSFREAENRCKNYFTRETIKGYCTDRFDSKGNPWFRSREKSPENTSPVNKKRGVTELEVWLPDVLCFALVMSTFETLEAKTDIINKRKVNGKMFFEYAPLSDEASQRTAIEHRGGIFLEIFTNFSNSFSPETINMVKNDENEMKAKNEMIKNKLANSS